MIVRARSSFALRFAQLSSSARERFVDSRGAATQTRVREATDCTRAQTVDCAGDIRSAGHPRRHPRRPRCPRRVQRRARARDRGQGARSRATRARRRCAARRPDQGDVLRAAHEGRRRRAVHHLRVERLAQRRVLVDPVGVRPRGRAQTRRVSQLYRHVEELARARTACAACGCTWTTTTSERKRSTPRSACTRATTASSRSTSCCLERASVTSLTDDVHGASKPLTRIASISRSSIESVVAILQASVHREGHGIASVHVRRADEVRQPGNASDAALECGALPGAAVLAAAVVRAPPTRTATRPRSREVGTRRAR